MELILVEGKDISLLKAAQDVLFPTSLQPVDTVPSMSIGGWGGWAYALGSAMLLKNAMNETITAYCILDSDYHTEDEIRERYVQATDRSVSLHIWSRKEIENYLLIPSLILRAIRAGLPARVSPPTEEEVLVALTEAAARFRDEIVDGFATEIISRDRKLSLSSECWLFPLFFRQPHSSLHFPEHAPDSFVQHLLDLNPIGHKCRLRRNGTRDGERPHLRTSDHLRHEPAHLGRRNVFTEFRFHGDLKEFVLELKVGLALVPLSQATIVLEHPADTGRGLPSTVLGRREPTLLRQLPVAFVGDKGLPRGEKAAGLSGAGDDGGGRWARRDGEPESPAWACLRTTLLLKRQPIGARSGSGFGLGVSAVGEPNVEAEGRSGLLPASAAGSEYESVRQNLLHRDCLQEHRHFVPNVDGGEPELARDGLWPTGQNGELGFKVHHGRTATGPPKWERQRFTRQGTQR